VRAIRIAGKGTEARLVLEDAPEPTLAAGQMRIRVRATAVNRADLMQRRGLYPPPPGAPDIPGLECAGTVTGVAPGLTRFRTGDRVMALLPGGGYAEQVTVDAGSVLPIPEHLPFEEAAGIPEVFLTCSLNLFQLARVPGGGAALVHGGGSGIGTAAIQLLRHAGVAAIVTAGSKEKLERCRALGADLALDYHAGDFAPAVLEFTKGRGVDVVLDSIGAPYLASHLRCLATGGRLVLIGLMGGARAELDLGAVVAKRLQLIGSTLRARPVAEKAEIVRAFDERFGAALRDGRIRPVIDRVLPLERAQEAHDVLERSEHFGKVVLRVD
jgi:putative PIG3 family NAD(P)H quinone oxidoreductase